MKLTIYTDGAARGNPGPAGIGVAIYNEENALLEEHCCYLGTATNNVAEYRALLTGLDLAKKYLPCTLDFFLDSELVVRQMNGVYRVKDQNLAVLFRNARAQLADFQQVTFTHIPREKNKIADKLANRAIDTAAQQP